MWFSSALCIALLEACGAIFIQVKKAPCIVFHIFSTKLLWLFCFFLRNNLTQLTSLKGTLKTIVCQGGCLRADYFILFCAFIIKLYITSKDLLTKYNFTYMNLTFILLHKKNKKTGNMFSKLTPVGTLVSPFRFVFFSHAAALCRDPAAPDPCVSEEWGQQQHSGVNTFSRHCLDYWKYNNERKLTCKVHCLCVSDVYYFSLICIWIIDVLFCTLLQKSAHLGISKALFKSGHVLRTA